TMPECEDTSKAISTKQSLSDCMSRNETRSEISATRRPSDEHPTSLAINASSRATDDPHPVRHCWPCNSLLPAVCKSHSAVLGLCAYLRRAVWHLALHQMGRNGMPHRRRNLRAPAQSHRTTCLTRKAEQIAAGDVRRRTRLSNGVGRRKLRVFSRTNSVH